MGGHHLQNRVQRPDARQRDVVQMRQVVLLGVPAADVAPLAEEAPFREQDHPLPPQRDENVAQMLPQSHHRLVTRFSTLKIRIWSQKKPRTTTTITHRFNEKVLMHDANDAEISEFEHVIHDPHDIWYDVRLGAVARHHERHVGGALVVGQNERASALRAARRHIVTHFNN